MAKKKKWLAFAPAHNLKKALERKGKKVRNRAGQYLLAYEEYGNAAFKHQRHDAAKLLKKALEEIREHVNKEERKTAYHMVREAILQLVLEDT